jgi:hypothetical protein
VKASFITKGDLRHEYVCADVEELTDWLIRQGWTQTEKRINEFSKLSKGNSTITTFIGGRVTVIGSEAQSLLDESVSRCGNITPDATEALSRLVRRIEAHRAGKLVVVEAR